MLRLTPVLVICPRFRQLMLHLWSSNRCQAALTVRELALLTEEMDLSPIDCVATELSFVSEVLSPIAGALFRNNEQSRASVTSQATSMLAKALESQNAMQLSNAFQVWR
jgi:hypothetical protein